MATTQSPWPSLSSSSSSPSPIGFFAGGFATPADEGTLGVIGVTIDVVPAGELLSDAGAYSVCVDI